MKKNIWIINHHANDDYEDDGGRHYYFAKYLKRFGYEPVVFCSNAIHGKNKTSFPNDKLWQKHIVDGAGCPFIFVKGRPYQGNGKQRILCMFDFYFNILKTAKEYIKSNPLPDVIYASSVHPLALAAGIKLAKKFKIKCICEIRDLWPESFVSYGLISPTNPILKPLYLGEKLLYKKADSLIFTMAGGVDYITDKKWDISHGGPIDLGKINHINNGVDLEIYDYNKEHFVFADNDLQSHESFKIIYCGSLRKVNDLSALLGAAELCKKNGADDVQILIYGDGDKRKDLEKEIALRELDNVIIKGFIKKKYIPYILSNADACYVDGGTDIGLSKYGMSQNKLFDYLASRKPIISPRPSRFDIVKELGCGICVNNTADEVFEAIIKLKNEGIPAENMASAAKEYDFKNLTLKLIDILEE